MFKKEYRKHLIGLLQSLAPFLGVLVISFAIWTIVFSVLILPLLKEYKTINGLSFDYILESKESYSEYKALWKLENIITVEGNHSGKMNANTYIISQGESPFEYELAENEVAISLKLAKRLRVKQGEILSVHLPIYDNPVDYKVKHVFTYISDYYEPLDNTDFSVIILGRNDDIIQHSNGRYVYFLTKQIYKDYINNDYSYSGKYLVSNDKDLIHDRIVLIVIVMHIFLVLMDLAAIFYAKQEIEKEIIKYYHDGYERTYLHSFARKDFTFFLVIPFTIHLLVVLILQLKNPFFVIIPIITTMIMVIVAIVLCVFGGRKFGKAD